MFKNNSINSPNNSDVKDEGIKTEQFSMIKQSDWLYIPSVNQTEVFVGFDFETIKKDIFGNDRTVVNASGAIVLSGDRSKGQINKNDYGSTWFSNEKKVECPKTIKISSSKELIETLSKAASGTIIELKKGVYNLDASLVIDKEITMKSFKLLFC